MDFGQGALISGGMQMLGNYQNFQYQKQLAAIQNQYNIDMWKMQADYNTPQAQMNRFKQAGLNPNLIYGQGNNGNMTSAPQMVTPSAPDYSEGLGKIGEGIGKLFNIENIRIIRAQRKKAEAEASSAHTDAERNEMQLDADKQLGSLYYYDDKSGRYLLRPSDQWFALDKYKAAEFYKMQALANNYNRNFLIPARNALLGSQRSYLQPQIHMANYEAKYIPYSYWIGQGTRVVNALPLPKLSFGKSIKENYYYKR